MPCGANTANIKTQPTTTMITTQPQVNVVTQGVQGAVSFGIKNDGLAHIFNVLRNQLYSNKILAVLREYSCNAVDSHVEAGHNRAIEVTLPSRLSLELKIRDFGIGLSEQDIQEIYAFYGESTKRKSNSLIGQLGLGSKSAFAYGDNFVINSYLNGTKTIYNAYIDPSQIGQIAKLASSPTSEANGVEIVIPVKPADCDTFVHTAKELFRYFKVKPVIRGVADFQYEQSKATHSGNDWRILETNRNQYGRRTVAIMGNIAYSVSESALKLDENNEDEAVIERMLNNCNIELDVPIGELDIAASREGLQYTERTIANLKKRILVVRDALVAEVTKALDGANSLWSFKRMLGEMHDYSSPYYVVCNALRGKSGYNFKGQIVKDFTVNFSKASGFKSYTPRKGYVAGAYTVKGGKSEDLHHIVSLDSRIVLVENTKQIKTQIINHIFPFLQQDKKVIVCEFPNAKSRKLQMDSLGLVESDIVDMTTLPKVLLPRATRRSNGSNQPFVSKSKHTSKVFSLDPNAKSLSSYHKVKSDFWVEEDIDLSKIDTSKYCYIEIERFCGKVKTGLEIGPVAIMSSLEKLKAIILNSKAKNIEVPHLIGIKAGSTLDKVKKSKMMDFATFIANALKAIENQTNFCEVFYSQEIFNEFVSKNACLKNGEVKKMINANNAPNTHRLLQEVLQLEAVKDGVITLGALRYLCDHLGIKIDTILSKRSARLDAMKVKADKLSHAMRLLHFVDSYELQTYRTDHKSARESVLDYIVTRDNMLAGV